VKASSPLFEFGLVFGQMSINPGMTLFRIMANGALFLGVLWWTLFTMCHVPRV
jgi:hypothetical protein